MQRGRQLLATVFALACALPVASSRADVPLGGFIPLVGIGMTRQFATADDPDDGDTFFLSKVSDTWGGTPLGSTLGGTPHFELALLDTGSAADIITLPASDVNHFGMDVPYSGNSDGFAGTNTQPIFGATGEVDLMIEDPLGIYAGGLAHSTTDGTKLTMDTSSLRGQTSVSVLEAPASWTLPNVMGLPTAAQHGIVIRNSQPQVFQYQGRTVRSPEVDLIPLGSGAQQGITRRTNLRLNPSASFIAGPAYTPSLDLGGLGGLGGDFDLHENPQSPSVVDSGGLYVDVDVSNGANSVQGKQILLDTGADITVLSEVFAASLGLDITQKTPDFRLEVEGSGGVVDGVPGYYVDQLKINAVGGPVTLNHVPVAVLDVPNPTEPANAIDAILGMNLFTDRDLVIDAVPAATGNGSFPKLYISDPITQTHTWASATAAGTWSTAGNWTSASTSPGNLWITDVRNTSAGDKTANVSASSQVFQMNVTATSTGKMIVQVQNAASLTVFGETRIDAGGTIALAPTGRLDAEVVNIQGGTLAGTGTVFVGSGPVTGVVRNLSGRVAPGQFGTVGSVGQLTITGDFSNLGAGTVAIDIDGLTAITQYDRLAADRYAFLGGTLEVALNGFTPSVGNTFTILTSGQGISGQFQNLVLPQGFIWNVAYGANNVVLSVTGLGLAGDFNSDGNVDARDYIVWRTNGGSAADYQLWRNNFGATSGSGSGSSAAGAVPEPAVLFLMLAAAGGLLIRCRYRPARSAASTRCAEPFSM